MKSFIFLMMIGFSITACIGRVDFKKPYDSYQLRIKCKKCEIK